MEAKKRPSPTVNVEAPDDERVDTVKGVSPHTTIVFKLLILFPSLFHPLRLASWLRTINSHHLSPRVGLQEGIQLEEERLIKQF